MGRTQTSPSSPPRGRLDALDFHRQLDAVTERWADDEILFADRLVRLRRSFEQLPTRYWEAARPHLTTIASARIATRHAWREAILELRDIVSRWDSTRPPLLMCEHCGIALRGHPQLSEHVAMFHEETPA